MPRLKPKRQNAVFSFRVIFGLFFGLVFFLTGVQKSQATIAEKINYQGKLTDSSNVTVADGAYDVIFNLYTTAGGGTSLWTESWTDAALWTDINPSAVARNDGTCGGTGYTRVAYSNTDNEETLLVGQSIWNMTLKESAIISAVETGSNYFCLYNPFSTWSSGDDLTNRIYVRSGLFSTMLGSVQSLSAVDFSQTLYLGVTIGTDPEMKPRKVIGSAPSAFTAKTLNNNGSATLATTAGATLSIGNTTGTVTMLSGGASSWNNTSGNLTVSTITSGTLAITSAEALNLSSALASTWTLADTTNALNFDSNTLSIDALNNRVGIGTTTPNFKLHVNNGARGTYAEYSGQSGERGFLGGYASFGSMYNAELSSAGVWTARGTSASVSELAGGEIRFYTDTGLTSGNTFTPSQRVTINNLGNVGIGTTTPGAKLDVNGSVNVEGAFGLNTAISGTHDFMFRSNNLNRWIWEKAGTETGSNAGADLTLYRYNDAGAYLGTVMNFVRSTGQVDISQNLSVGNQLYTTNINSGSINSDLSLGLGATNVITLLKTSGNVGIGTTTPGYKLDVAGDINITGNFKVNGTNLAAGIGGAGTANYLPIFATGTTLGNSAIYQSSGNIGIGTTGPDWLLVVSKNTSATSYGNYPGIALENTDAAGYMTLMYKQGTTQLANLEMSTATGNLSIYTAANKNLLLQQSSGNVGIGTTSPGYRLTVENNDGVGSGLHFISGFQRSAGSDAQILVGYAANGSVVTAPYIYSANSQPLAFYTGGANRLHIENGGNVGIGTTTPTNTLQAKGGALTVGTSTTYAFGTGNSNPADLTIGSDASYAYIQSWNSKPLYLNNQGNIVYMGGNLNLGANTITSGLINGQTISSAANFTGTITAGGVIVASQAGFQSATYAAGRNRMWSFGNADGYGISYFQGAGGYGGADSIGMHFGTATAAGSQFTFAGSGNFIATGSLSGASLNVGAGAITSGLINGQTISSAANFTGSLNAVGNVVAYGFQGNGNVGGTGSASWHPSGIYSAGTNWLYGSVIFNGALTGATTANFSSTVTAPTFSGALSGNATTATNATYAAEATNNYFYVRGTSPSTLYVDTDDGVTRYVHQNGGNIGFLGNGGSWILRVDDAGTVIANTFSGALSGNASTATYATSAGNADTVDSLHASSFSRKDTTIQWMKPYYEYGNYISSESPATLRDQMGGGGLRVDFMHPSYTGSGNWNHVMTWSGYGAYNMYQLGGHYDGGTGTELWVRSEANHQLTGWTTWRKIIDSSSIGSQSVSYASTAGSATSAGNADTVDSQHFAWSNADNNPSYLWGANSNGSSFLAARGSMSVNYANYSGYTTGNAATADKVNSYGSSPDNSHPGTGLRPFYSWNIGQANNPTAGYSNGISVGSHPGDQSYGFQIVQNMWDDRLYFRRYNAGWQGWLTVIDSATIGSQSVSYASTAGSAPANGGTATQASYLNTAGLYYQGGSVGIGMTGPGYTLDVNGSASATAFVAGAGAPAAYASGTGYSFKGAGDWDGGLFSTADGVVSIYTNATQVLTANANNVGIGTTAPAANLNVQGTTGLHLQYSNAYGANGYRLFTASDHSYLGIGYVVSDAWYPTAGTPAMAIQAASGNVGIGVVAPTYKLQLNGQPAANGYTAWTNYSDQRLKENITPIEGADNVLDKIMQLNPVTFNYNSLTGYDQETRERRISGFIAQQLQAVFPEMVGETTINNKTYLDTNLSDLPLYLIKGMQAQQIQLEGLTQNQNTLSEQIDLVNSVELKNLLGTMQTLNLTETIDALKAQDAIFDGRITALEASLGQEQALLSGLEKANENDNAQATGEETNTNTLLSSLVFSDSVEFSQSTAFRDLAEFFQTVSFNGSVVFKDSLIAEGGMEISGELTVGEDSAGYAVVKEGTDRVLVSFANDYLWSPIVNTSLSLGEIEDAQVRQATEQLLLVYDIRFIITNITQKGFEIRISEIASADIPFAWTAVSVKAPKTFFQEKVVLENTEEATQVADETGEIAESTGTQMPTADEDSPQTGAVTGSFEEEIEITGGTEEEPTSTGAIATDAPATSATEVVPAE